MPPGAKSGARRRSDVQRTSDGQGELLFQVRNKTELTVAMSYVYTVCGLLAQWEPIERQNEMQTHSSKNRGCLSSIALVPRLGCATKCIEALASLDSQPSSLRPSSLTWHMWCKTHSIHFGQRNSLTPCFADAVAALTHQIPDSMISAPGMKSSALVGARPRASDKRGASEIIT